MFEDHFFGECYDFNGVWCRYCFGVATIAKLQFHGYDVNLDNLEVIDDDIFED